MKRIVHRLTVSICLCGLLITHLTACQPKSAPQPTVPAVSQPSTSAQQAIPALAPSPVANPASLLVQTALDDSEYVDNLTLTTLMEHTQGPNTLMLVRVQGYPHVGGLDNLALGVWDANSQAFVGDTLALRGDQACFASWEENGSLCLLLTNSGVNHGWETCLGALYFRFADGKLKPISEFPDVTLSSNISLPDAPDVFLSGREPYDRSDYWENHKLLPVPGGMELFVRTEGWDRIPVAPDGTALPQPQWTYECFVPLSEDAAPPRSAVEFLRAHLEQRSYTMGELPGSAQFQIQSCTQLPEAACADHPGAQVWRFEIATHFGEVFQRDVLLDPDSGQPIGLHAGAEFAVTLGGVSYPLGCETPDLFGSPAQTNYTNAGLGDGTWAQNYSQWFTGDFPPACDYTYYPDTGEYRLNNLRVSHPDAETARGIHPGSTGAELLAAYPELAQEFQFPPNCISFYEADTGCALEFYLDWPGDGTGTTPGDWTVSELILFAPYWYDAHCAVPSR